MKLDLIDFSQNALGNIVLAGRNCYQSESTGYDSDVKLAKALIKADHPPVEFAWAMWHVRGISRACADQLARHRLLSFTMLSQRYCNVSNLKMIHPFKALETAGESALAIEKSVKDFYTMLINNGIAREDARYYMPMGLETEIYFACNFRELRHILKLRLDKHAQAEIRALAEELLKICKNKWPWLVEDINANE